MNNINRKYLSTTTCNIVSNKDSSFTQTVTYKVDNTEYTQNIPANIIKNKNDTTLSYAHPEGNCKLYYSNKDPNIYSVNSDPVQVSIISTIAVLVIGIIVVIYFIFIRSHRKFAGIMGGIDIASSIFKK